MPEAIDNPGTLQTFRRKAEQFADSYTRLMNIDPSKVPSELKPEYENLKSKGSIIKATIENVTGAADTVADIGGAVWGYGEAAWDWAEDAWTDITGFLGFDERQQKQLNGLGVVFTIPVILGVSGIAALAWFINSVYQFERRLSQYQRLQESGKITENQFLDSITGDSSFFPNLTSAIPLVVIIGGALLLINAMDEN